MLSSNLSSPGLQGEVQLINIYIAFQSLNHFYYRIARSYDNGGYGRAANAGHSGRMSLAT